MSIKINSNFAPGSPEHIDARQYLSFEEMRNIDEAIYPEEYSGKTTDEIAAMVQSRIQKELSFNVKALDHKRMSESKDSYYRFNAIK